MSYIAFDLDALNVSRDVGAAAGVPEERITHGLLRMWAWCFREKTDTVQAIQVQGFFGTSAAPALVAFGFLAPAGADFRVRGAERYLRISDARSKGGHAAKSNLIPGGPKRSTGRASSRDPRSAPAETQPSTTLGSTSALTPSTEHRAPNTESKSTAPLFASPAVEAESHKVKPQKDSDLLVYDFKVVTGSDYVWNGAKDGAALAALLKAVSLDEVRTRWRRGLEAPASAWASCRTVAQLRQKWNDLVPATVAGPPKSTRDDTGPIRAIVHTRWPTS